MFFAKPASTFSTSVLKSSCAALSSSFSFFSCCVFFLEMLDGGCHTLVVLFQAFVVLFQAFNSSQHVLVFLREESNVSLCVDGDVPRFHRVCLQLLQTLGGSGFLPCPSNRLLYHSKQPRLMVMSPNFALPNFALFYSWAAADASLACPTDFLSSLLCGCLPCAVEGLTVPWRMIPFQICKVVEHLVP